MRRYLRALRIVRHFTVGVADICFQIGMRIGGLVITWKVAEVVVLLVGQVESKGVK